jgi:inorganic pyrophosphatase
MYDDVQTHEDLPQQLLQSLEHFFQHYKDLEKGKWVKVDGWAGPDIARQEIMDSIARYQQQDN